LQATSEPTIKQDYFHLVYISELLETARTLEEEPIVPSSTIPGQHKGGDGAPAKQERSVALADGAHRTDISSYAKRGSNVLPAKSPKDTAKSLNFGRFLRKCMSSQQYGCPAVRDCGSEQQQVNQATASPPACPSGSARIRCYSLDTPMALAISLCWAVQRESPEVIADVLSVITYSIKVSDFFFTYEAVGTAGNGQKCDTDNQPQNDSAQNQPVYIFRGMVCYYGKHYVSIFQEYSPGEPRFLLFDDSNIR
jgi:hypothetical protein